MGGWSIRLENDEVEVGGFGTGFAHASIGLFDPNGARVSSYELASDLASRDVVFQSAESRKVDNYSHSFVTGLTEAQANHLFHESKAPAEATWSAGGGYELPPSLAAKPVLNAIMVGGTAFIASGAFAYGENSQKALSGVIQ